MYTPGRGERGFTLIELSIVLVVIGLIVGGVLVGQDLIRAAAVRAQITQIEKFNTAVNTFRDKYGGLPGDLPAAPAAQFGFGARGQYAGEGDGNGVIEGVSADAAASNGGIWGIEGETATFWVDLSTAKLIEGGYSMAGESSKAIWGGDVSGNDPFCGNCNELANLLPPAKIGQGNSVHVWSWNGTNYFGLSGVSAVLYSNGSIKSTPALTVYQALSIDKKIDDGLPQSGNVTTLYVNGPSIVWPTNFNNSGQPYTAATPGSATSCYDNSNGSGPQQYSVEINNGAGVNCALSFRFQ